MIDIDKIVSLLKDAKQPQSEFVKLMDSFKNPYLVLIACILSLRTNDKTTYPATLRMLELAKTPKEMKNVSQEELAKAIYPVGFYENKAKQIIELSKIIDEELKKSPYVKYTTGKGLMVGIELDDKKLAADIVQKCIDNGLIVLTAKKRIRLLPPLNISFENLRRGLDILKKVLESE